MIHGFSENRLIPFGWQKADQKMGLYKALLSLWTQASKHEPT